MTPRNGLKEDPTLSKMWPHIQYSYMKLAKQNEIEENLVTHFLTSGQYKKYFATKKQFFKNPDNTTTGWIPIKDLYIAAAKLNKAVQHTKKSAGIPMSKKKAQQRVKKGAGVPITQHKTKQRAVRKGAGILCDHDKENRHPSCRMSEDEKHGKPSIFNERKMKSSLLWKPLALD